MSVLDQKSTKGETFTKNDSPIKTPIDFRKNPFIFKERKKRAIVFNRFNCALIE